MTATDRDPDGLPPLPPALEDRLHAILLDMQGDERRVLFDELVAASGEFGPALVARAAAMAKGDGALALAREPLIEVPLPERIGPYAIQSLLGEGGFGMVYRAEQLEPVRRIVALKVLHARRVDARSEWRFLAERQTLARMQHANIAQIFDAGTTADGRHFFAMEFVDGEPITAWCDRNGLPIAARLGLFARVCAAIEHAHQRGAIHRDLKPGNVLVQDAPGGGEPKVIDFGVAKVLEEAGDFATLDGAVIGTLGYMSPEQAAGNPVDTRTDVYSLGVLLYELLTGDLPVARRRLVGSATENARIVRESDPRRLTTAVREHGEVLARIATQRACSSTALLRTLDGDLEWIVRRALARDPEARYPSVAHLHADVARFLTGQPVAARQHETLYVVRRFLQRHRAGVAVAAAVALAAVGVIVVLSWMLGQVDRARATAVERGDTAIRNEYAAHVAAARAALEIGDRAGARTHLDAAAPAHRAWEWQYLDGFCDTSRTSLAAPTATLVEWLDPARVCIAGFDGAVQVWQPANGAVEPLRWGLGGVKRWCWSRDHSTVFAIVDDHRTVVALDAHSGRRRTLFRAASLPRDGRSLLRSLLPGGPFGGFDLPRFLWDLRRGRPDRQRDVRSLALTPEGDALVISDNTGAITWLDAAGRAPPRQLCRSGFYAVALQFSADGRWLVAGRGDGHVEVRAALDGRLRCTAMLAREGVSALAIDPTGRTVFATAGFKLHKIDAESGAVLQRVPIGFDAAVLRLVGDAQRLYVGGGIGGGRLVAFSTAMLEPIGRFHGHDARVEDLDFDPGCSSLVSVSRSSARVFDAVPRAAAVRLDAGWDTYDLGFAADGESFAAATSHGLVRVWAARSCALEFELQVDARVFGCALTPATVYLAGSRLLAVDRRTRAIRAGAAPPQVLGQIVCDPDGRWLAARSLVGDRVRVYALPTLQPSCEVDGAAAALAFDDVRGTFVATAPDGTLRWIDPQRGEVGVERAPGSATTALATVQGTLAVAGDRLAVRAADDAEFAVFVPGLQANSVALTSDLRRIAVGTKDNLVRLLDRTGKEMLVLDDAERPVTRLAFVAGGTRLVGLAHVSGSWCQVMVWATAE